MGKKPFIIGIAGGSGSGKTFFLKCFLEHFTADEVCLVSQDDYYHPVAAGMTKEEIALYNFDLPKTINNGQLIDDINLLINGHTVYKEEYTFNNLDIVPQILEIKPAPILIVEGLFIFHFKEIAEKLDLKIFIEAEEQVALSRRLKRDLEERGYSHEDVLYRWENHVMPAYKEYLLPYRDECHQVIVNNTQQADEIIMVTEVISRELRENVLSGE
ncbi:uridine kinase family protein [Mucilaginibacter ginsenosidivorans]|uniref:Uridine kinase n=1 Tax=Mucilaginibacter ginsenosidivorans TaxID=398053 RepID=A0A5B8V0D7_9SPHI|nr:uridine kinase [Mucilaginibacter ginsenosidivorans]QEC64091.1 uridine kinase [Mucilaginibacter ginsenosidivorans]